MFKCQHAVWLRLARCQTNFAGSMAAASGSGYFYSAVAPTVICSNGAQKAAPNKPVCYRNIVAETLVLMGVFFPRCRLQDTSSHQVVSCVSTVTVVLHVGEVSRQFRTTPSCLTEMRTELLASAFLQSVASFLSRSETFG